MRCLGCAKEISDDEKYCDECKIKMADEQIEKEEQEDIKKAKKKKRQQYLVVIAVVLVILAASSVVMPAIIRKAEQQEEKEVAEANKLSSAEFKAVIDAYGASASLAINNYMNSNDGVLPKFDDIESNIVFERYSVKCDDIQINYDGSLYLSACKVDGEEYDDDYSYCKKIEKPETKTKSGDKLYIYKITPNNTNFSNITYSVFSSPVDTSSPVTQYATYDLLDTYECNEKSCKGFRVSGVSNQAFVYDGDYILYNYINKQTKKLNISDFEKDRAAVRLIEGNNSLIGLGLPDSKGKYSVYSLAVDKEITDHSYYSVYTTNSLAKVGQFFVEADKGAAILSITDAALIKMIPGYYNFSGGDNGLYTAMKMNSGSGDTLIFDKDFNLVVKDDVQGVVLNSDLSLTGKKANSFAVYDFSGNKVIQSDEFKSIVKVIKDYVIVIDKNDDLQVYSYKNQKLATLTNVAGNYSVHSALSGWYSNKGKEGIYVVVENKDISYGTNGSGNEYYYIPSTGEVGVVATKGVGGYAKPVLYLYPKKETTVKVSFEHNELLTTTYPKFKNVWKVTANKNGDLYDSKGRYYYGLYWEEEENHNIDFSTGFYVTKDNAIDFLEEKLDKIGFTQREANEFIMYWLPILEKNGKNLVYFELTDEREAYNKLIIEPKVDSLLRVAMHVKKVDQEVNIKEQKLPTFKRKGFTAVEWGGVIH